MAEPIVNVVGVASILKVFLLDCIRWYQIPVERIQFHCTGLELYLGQSRVDVVRTSDFYSHIITGSPTVETRWGLRSSVGLT